MAAHVLTGRGEHGFDDRHRGQMMVVTGKSSRKKHSKSDHHNIYHTGPMLCAGAELATAASEALGSEMKFESISE